MTYKELYNRQVSFQEKVNELHGISEELPCEDLGMFQTNVLYTLCELGEVLQADKRWKTYRTGHYDRDEKKEELADVWIVFTNMCISSGFSAEEIEEAIYQKQNVNLERLKHE